jgi:hypothetical protein
MRLLTVAAVAAVSVLATVGAEAAGKPRVPRLERIVVVVFENKDFGEVIGSPSAPTFNAMARRYALLRRYYAVARPSLPNYLAVISGSTQGLTETCTECVFDDRNLADVLITFDEASHGDDRGGGGHIATLAVGPAVLRGAQSNRGITHYGLLRTIEDGWGLPRLGRSASANAATGIWR